MKKIITILIFTVYSVISFGQFGTVTNLPGNPNSISETPGAIRGKIATLLTVYPDTATASSNGKTNYYGGSAFYNSTTQSIWYRNANKWVEISPQTANCPLSLEGAAIWSTVELVYNVTATTYNFPQSTCTFYHTIPTQITLSPANPSQDRKDVIYVDITQNVGVLTGTPGSGVPNPVDPFSQRIVAIIDVPAGSTVPGGGTSSTIVYNENVEWSGTSTVSGANFSYGASPYIGSVSALFPTPANGSTVIWQNGSQLNIGSYGYFPFHLRLNAAPIGNPVALLTVTFYDGTTQVTAPVQVGNGMYGCNYATLNAWQEIDIPISAPFNGTPFDRVKITFNGAPTLQIDYAYLLQNNPVPPQTNTQWNVTGLNDISSLFKAGIGTSSNNTLDVYTAGNLLGKFPVNWNINGDSTLRNVKWNPADSTFYLDYTPTIIADDPLEIYKVGFQDHIRFNGSTGGTGLNYILSPTQPTDTTLGWINTSINILECFPVQYRANGQWTPIDTISGQFYDNVGKVFTRGKPYKIVVTGQSNPAGPYIGTLPDPDVAPYYGYYGDTIPARSVGAWDYNTNSWKVGDIGTVPFASASGANFVLLTAKKITQSTGRSVRIVMTYAGGTPLQCWSGAAVGGIPDTAACYIAFTDAITASGVKSPDLFIWGQSEGGITGPGVVATTYYTKWVQTIDSLRSQGYIDTTTTILFCGSGDPVYGNSKVIGIGATGDGAGRAIGYDRDRYTDYVDVLGVPTDGIHFTPLGHEEIARRMFQRLADVPIDLQKKMLGYGDTSAFGILSVDPGRNIIGTGIVFSSVYGRPIVSMVNGNIGIFDPDTAIAGSGARLQFSRTSGNGLTEWYDYAGDRVFMQSNGRLQWSGGDGIVSSIFRAQSAANPTIEWYALETNKKWKVTNTLIVNNLDFKYDDGSRMTLSPITGILGVNVSNQPDLLGTSQLTVNSTTRGALLPRMTAAQRLALIGVNSVTVGGGGSGYVNNTPAIFTGGGGSGAAGLIQVTAGAITSVLMTSSGTGYTSNPTVTGATGTGATLTAVRTTPAGLIVFDTDSSSYFQWTGAAWQNLYNIGSASPWVQGSGVIYPTNLSDFVGIGTTTPTAVLDIVGNIKVTAGGNNSITTSDITTIGDYANGAGIEINGANDLIDIKSVATNGWTHTGNLTVNTGDLNATGNFVAGTSGFFPGSGLLGINMATALAWVGDHAHNVNSTEIVADDDNQTVTINANNGSTINGGTVTISDLAGTGSRPVLADASGVLSAPVSDRSVKKNIQTLTYGLNTINKLKPVSFEYITGWQNYGKGKQIGFIAQDVQKVLPNSTFTTPPTGKMGYVETDIIPILVKAVQELSAKVDAQAKEIKKLKRKKK